jgi:ABC-type Zn uptake system ZnuABC Zn-binding protein ZnuA
MAGRLPRRGLLAVLLVVGLLLVGACGGEEPEPKSERGVAAGKKVKVVTTVAPITSIAANVAGDLAQVEGVVPEGTNSHTFEPAPSVAEELSQADLIFVNGLSLEEPTRRLAESNLKGGARIVELGTEVLPESEWIYDFSFPKREGKPNPHLWTDPTYAKRYAEIIRRELADRDPPNSAGYQRNYDAFAALVDEFDGAMRTSFATMPKERRKLLTYHDAFAYFARTYDWEVIGAIQVENFEDPSPKEVAALIDQVKATKVPAIFGSEVFPSPVLAQIGKEAGVKYVDVLRDDDLPGKPGDPQHSWVGLMHFDYVTMVEALGGDASALRAFVPRNVAPDRAAYPQ